MKAPTQVGVTNGAVVVFGPATSGKPPCAGLFPARDRYGLEQLAQTQGLAILEVLGEKARLLASQLHRARMLKGKRLRLSAISPSLFNTLHTMQLSQSHEGDEVTRSSTQAAAPPVGDPPEMPPPSPPEVPDLGPGLIAACSLMETAGTWFEHLRADLTGILSRVGKASEFSFLRPLEPQDAAYSGGDGWVLNGWRWTFPVRVGRERLGNLSFIADIGRDGRPAAAIGLPCLIVVWSGTVHDWVADIDAAADFWPPQVAAVRLENGRLFRWLDAATTNERASGSPMTRSSWFYLVPVQALQTVVKVRTLLVQPTLELLAGSDFDGAFAAAPEVLQFKRLGDGNLAIA